MATTDIRRTALAGKKIGFFGKGGAGKSTTVVLTAQALAQAGYTVCVVDADSTNIGLHRAFGLDVAPVPLLDYFGGMVFSGGSVTCPVDDPTPLPGARIVLDDLPAAHYARADSGVFLLSGGKLGELGAGCGCDGPITKIARDIQVEKNGEPVVTLVDFKAGFEDTARGVVVRLDWALVVVDPTQASLALAAQMKTMVEGIRAGRLPATRHLPSADLVALANRLFHESPLRGVLVVLNRVADEPTEWLLRRRLAAAGIEPLGVIREDPGIRRAWLQGSPLAMTNAALDVERIVQELERTIAEPAAMG